MYTTAESCMHYLVFISNIETKKFTELLLKELNFDDNTKDELGYLDEIDVEKEKSYVQSGWLVSDHVQYIRQHLDKK